MTEVTGARPAVHQKLSTCFIRRFHRWILPTRSWPTRSNYASGLLDAAGDARRGDASALQDDIAAAHIWAGRAHYRAVVQDQDPANA